MQVMQAVKIKKDTQTDTGNASKITLNLFGGKRLRRSEFFLMLEYIVAEVGWFVNQKQIKCMILQQYYGFKEYLFVFRQVASLSRGLFDGSVEVLVKCSYKDVFSRDFSPSTAT